MNRMRLFACAIVLLGLGCKKDATFTEPVPNYAHITWLNAVTDTMQLDVRVVDIASNTGFPDADFRSSLPFPLAIEPGDRHIKVFLSSTADSVAKISILDTTFTFEGGQPYFFYLSGRARAGGLRATITPLTPPTVPAGQFAIRFLNLAPSLAGSVRAIPDTTAAPDIFVIKRNVRPSGTPTVSGLAYGAVTPYILMDTASYRVELLAPGSSDPAVVQVTIPPGDTARVGGTPGIAGSRISGSVITAVIVSRSAPGSPAPQSRPTAQATDTSVSEAARRMSLSGDTVTVQVGSTTILVNRRSATAARADSTLSRTGIGGATAATAGQVILVSGATEVEYNGWQEVLAIADTLICKPGRTGDVATGSKKACKAPTDTTVAYVGDTAITRFRFRYRITGTPASPATGTPVYRLYPANYNAPDFATPQINFMVDKRP